jgi:anhydro-N-acetylmuramic acid kinase
MDELYIGFMSGTSGDGVDASLIKTDGENSFFPIHDINIPYDFDIKKQLRNGFGNIRYILEIEQQITNYHIKAGQKLLNETGYSSAEVRAIGFHGQTLFHDAYNKLTCQIGNPHALATILGINVIHDFRRRDIAYGGQGAPLIPIFHKLLARYQELPCVIVNIGGVANLTYISKKNLVAFDTGSGNALIDDMTMRYYKKPYDDRGEIASSGKVDHNFINVATSDAYYKLPYPKSLDRNRFVHVMKYLERKTPEDIIANLTYLTAKTIVDSINLLPTIPKKIFICGGGAKNLQMLQWIEEIVKEKNINCLLSEFSQLSNSDSDYVESQGFAYLAARFCHNLPSAFPNTTGAKASTICGCLVTP